jgi:hypothetical protein
MSFTVAVWPSTRPRWITPHDASRCYVLYDDVECNIPRWGSLGEYGAWDWARGLVVELHRRLGGTPVSLHYHELLTRYPLDDRGTRAHLPVGIEVTAILRDRDGQDVTVVSRRETAPYGPRGEHWHITVNGEIPEDADDPALSGRHTRAPSLPFLALLVQTHLHRTAAQPTASSIVAGRRAQ